MKNKRTEQQEEEKTELQRNIERAVAEGVRGATVLGYEEGRAGEVSFTLQVPTDERMVLAVYLRMLERIQTIVGDDHMKAVIMSAEKSRAITTYPHVMHLCCYGIRAAASG